VAIDLSGLLHAIAGRSAVVVGDAMLDVYLRGSTRGLCREAPAPAVTVQATERVPGGAANAAANLAALGGRPALVSVVGDDLAGQQLAEALRARGVPADGLHVVPGRDTIVKSRVVVGSHILLRLDEGTTSGINAMAESAVRRNLADAAGADALVISDSGYGTLTPRVLAGVAELRATTAVTVVDAKDPAGYAGLRPTAATPNYAESVRLLGLPGLDEDTERVRQIRERGAELLDATAADLVVTTLGGAGAILFERGRQPFHSRVRVTTDQEIVGAGDVFAAALALALAAGAEPVMAVELATLAAALAAAKPTGTAVGSHGDVRASLRATDKVLAPAEVSGWARVAEAAGRRIVFTNGCFDLVHEGHVAFLNEAKALGDLLIVGVNDDESVRSLKGPGRPVVDLAGRMRLLAALSCVDQVVPFSGPTPAPLIEQVRPHVFAKGGDYQAAALPEADLLRGLGVEIRILTFVADRSTTGIIDRVRSLS